MIDPKKIFDLFSQVNENTPKTDKEKITDQLLKVQDSPAFKLGMFNKIIFNHLAFGDQLIRLVKRADEDFDIDDVKNASEYIIYVRAWEYIVDFDLKDIDSFNILKNYSSQELQTSIKLSVLYFQEKEEYEKCAHLHQIEKTIDFFLI
jgi:hypothetical protein|tara:strand:+ start:328 stop:771 length:444 start_codon:yes stop_codon:yes gene_type:complete